MSIHLLATLDTTDTLVDDIDFNKLIALSEGQCIIIEAGFASLIGRALPDRTNVVVGEITDEAVIATCQVVKTPEEALSTFKRTVCPNAIVVGNSMAFIKAFIPHAHHFHLNIESDADRANVFDGRFEGIEEAQGWELTYAEINHATPKEGFEYRVKLDYKKNRSLS